MATHTAPPKCGNGKVAWLKFTDQNSCDVKLQTESLPPLLQPFSTILAKHAPLIEVDEHFVQQDFSHRLFWAAEHHQHKYEQAIRVHIWHMLLRHMLHPLLL